MNRYREAVFDALMWGQSVENLVRDIVLKCVANGELKISDQHLENVKNKAGLFQLADTLQSCISSDLYCSIKDLAKDRNEVAHRAADNYMKTTLNEDPPDEMEIWKLSEIKKHCGNIYGQLLEIHERHSK